jgi:hypothetical protein
VDGPQEAVDLLHRLAQEGLVNLRSQFIQISRFTLRTCLQDIEEAGSVGQQDLLICGFMRVYTLIRSSNDHLLRIIEGIPGDGIGNTKALTAEALMNCSTTTLETPSINMFRKWHYLLSVVALFSCAENDNVKEGGSLLKTHEVVVTGEPIFWYDAEKNGQSRFFDFGSMHYGTTSKGKEKPEGYFGGAIENCSNETLHCFFAGIPYSMPKLTGTSSWTIDQFDCEFSGSELDGSIKCRATNSNEATSVREFELEIVEGCIARQDFFVQGSSKKDYSFKSRDTGLCLSFLKQIS